MLINFALGCIGTVVTSDKISRDGHECTNLVSSNWQERKKGFIAEHFIKPPVNITFQFPCNVQIYQVFVTPYVGQQLSSQVEIYSASNSSLSNTQTKQNPKTKAEMVPEDTKNNSFSGPANSKASSSVSPTSAKLSLPLFYQVSKVKVSDYGHVCFTNNNFIHSSEPMPAFSTETRGQSMFTNTLQHHRKELLNAASHVSVRLAYTRQGFSVAVRNIEIWGVPALSVPSPLKNKITDNFIAYMKPKPVVSTTHHCGANQDNKFSKSSNEEKFEDIGLTIPEEFFDPLTCEVMSIPMLLPCGKNVDLSTLNRFFDSEASHGRAPRDPFTGVVFSENSEPISNIALKSRIDQFLFKHRNDKATTSVARTVNGILNLKTGILGKRNIHGKRLDGKISKLVSPCRGGMRIQNKPIDPQCPSNTSKHSMFHLTSQKERIVKRQSAAEKESLDKPEKPVLSASSCKSGSTSQISSKSHEQELKDSLHGALASILGGTSKDEEDCCSFQDFTVTPVKCVICNKPQSPAATLYNSSCNHTICRQCLTSQFQIVSAEIKCGVCGTKCKRQDFVRRH